MKKLLAIVVFVVAFGKISYANIQVGEWRMHFSYNSTTNVEITKDKVYAIADNKLFSVDKKDFSVQTYTKLSGLSENEVSLLSYDKQNDLLLIVYNNSNIDMIDKNGNIYNIPDLFRKNMLVSKKVNHIFFHNNFAYFSCDFGIMVLNLQKKEVADTYIIGDNAAMTPVYSITIHDGFVYALTNENIKKAPLQGVNLLNYESWTKAYDLPDNTQLFRQMLFFNDVLFVTKLNKDVYQYLEDSWSVFYHNIQEQFISIRADEFNLLVSNLSRIVKYNLDGVTEQLTDIVAVDAIYDEEERVYWIASQHLALNRLMIDVGQASYKPSSPYLSTAQRMYFNNGRIIVAPGKSWDDRFGLPGAVLLFNGNDWDVITAGTSGALDFSNMFADVVSVAVDPKDKNRLYVSTWGEGIFVFEDGEAKELYNGLNTNGILETAVPNNKNFYRIDGLNFDKKGNLWMLNSFSTTALKMKNEVGQWSSFSYPAISNQPLLRQMLFHSRGQKWIVSATGSGRGIFIIDDKGTIDNIADDATKFFSTFIDRDENVLIPKYFYDIVEDKDGTIWIGTDIGPILMTNVNRVFDSNYRCTRVKIPRNDGTILADFLLDNEEIRAIAVDAANRKWIGTANSGVYLLSPNGRETIYHFTVDNSPLSSNRIESIGIHEDTGEVLFSTTGGIVSFRSDATQPSKTISNIEIFPNPVRPDYTGLITIRGLVENTHVSIVNQAGQLVFKGVSNGGSIVWDGKSITNIPYSHGVYYVFCIKPDGTEYGREKFLILR